MGTLGHGYARSQLPSNPPRVRGNVRDAIRDDGVAAADRGQIGSGRAQLDPDLAREQGCSKRALAEAMDGVGQSAVCAGPSDVGSEPRALTKPADWRGRRPLVHFLKRAGLSKVTRPSPKGGRNPVEGPAPASCTAPVVPSASAPHPQPFSRKGRREQRRSREQAPLPPWEKEAKTIAGMIPSPVGRGSG